MIRTRRMGLTLGICLIGLLLAAAASPAMDLQEMLAGAVANDTRLKALSTTLANTLLTIERARMAPGFQMKLSTGEMRFGYSFHPESGDPPWVISAEPSGSMLLGRKTETQIQVEVPVAVGFGDGTEVALLPKVGIRQPLDKLFGGQKFTEAQDRQNRLAAEKARLDVLKRLQEIERQLLERLSALLALEETACRLDHELARARGALERSARLQSFPAGSMQQRQLEFAVGRLQRELELTGQRRLRARQELERMVGKTVETLPKELPEPALVVPDVTLAERNPEVFLASLAVELETSRLKEERQPSRPEWFLGGAVDSSYNEVKDRTYTTVGGTLEGVFDDVTVTAGFGTVVETGTVFVSAGLSLSLQDRRIESLNLQERENALEISRWNLMTAREAFLSGRELLALEVEELELRRRALAEERSLAAQRLTEATRQLTQGFATSDEVEDLRREVENLEYQALALRIDSLLLRNRLDSLVALDAPYEDGEKS